MDENPYVFPRQKKYRWSSQFGLYRYRSGSDSDSFNLKYKNLLNRRSNIQFFAIIAMFGVSIAFICFLIYASTSAEKAIQPEFIAFPTEVTTEVLQKVLVNHNTSILRAAKPSNLTLVPEGLHSMLRLPRPIPNRAPNPKLNKDEVFQPLYFDEYIPNLQPPPLKVASKRNFVVPSKPNPFNFYNEGPKPRAFTVHDHIQKRKYPQVEQYRYPETAMNIQDIIKYLTGKRRPRNKAQVPQNRVEFAANIHTRNYKHDLQNTQETTNSNGLILQNETPYQFYHDPFYNFKPPSPYDVNLLAPNKFRFAPTLIQNHKFVPEKQVESPVQKTKPVSVMLDIYPMSPELDDQKLATTPRPSRQAVRQTMLHNLNHLYHISKVHQQQQQQQQQKVQPGKVFDVTGFQKFDIPPDDLEKMILHLNLYPRKKNGHERHDSDHSETSLDYVTSSTSEKPKSNDPALRMDYKPLIEDVSENPIFNVPETIQNHIISKIFQDNIKSKGQEDQTIMTNIYQNQNFTPPQTKLKYHTLPIEVLQSSIAPVQEADSKYPSITYDEPPYNASEFPELVHIPSTTPKRSETSFQSGFYPVRFNNYTFSSERLDKNFLAGIAPNQTDVLLKRHDVESVEYDDQVMEETEHWMEDTLVENPNLANHKPYFQEVNDTLAA